MQGLPVSPCRESNNETPVSSAMRVMPFADVAHSAPSRATKSENTLRESRPFSVVMTRFNVPEGLITPMPPFSVPTHRSPCGSRHAEIKSFFRMNSDASGPNSEIFPSEYCNSPAVVASSQPPGAFSIQMTPASFSVSGGINTCGPFASNDKTPAPA